MKGSSFTLTLDVLPGTSIFDAVKEAKDISQKLNIAYVEFNFNGIKFCVGKKAVVENAEEALDDCFVNKKAFCILN